MKAFGMFFCFQLVAYFLNDFCNRCIAQADIPWSLVTAAIYAFVAFKVLKKISEAKCNMAMAGYIAGGTLGTYLAIVLSKLAIGR